MHTFVYVIEDLRFNGCRVVDGIFFSAKAVEKHIRERYPGVESYVAWNDQVTSGTVFFDENASLVVKLWQVKH